jgi:hypothetical protein
VCCALARELEGQRALTGGGRRLRAKISEYLFPSLLENQTLKTEKPIKRKMICSTYLSKEAENYNDCIIPNKEDDG